MPLQAKYQPSQTVIDTYLHQVSLARWNTTRWHDFGMALTTIVVVLARTRSKDRKRHPKSYALGVLISLWSLAFYVWKFWTPPTANISVTDYHEPPDHLMRY